MKFIYHTNGKDIVVAETICNEKKYKGEAKCAPGDKFDLEFGKKLAALRCEMKIRKETAKESLESADMYGETSRYFRRQAKMAIVMVRIHLFTEAFLCCHNGLVGMEGFEPSTSWI